MSLINEALKKAQRLRTEEPVGETPPMPGGGAKIAKRAQPRDANTTVLMVSGAIVLVVLSVIATVFLVNRPSKHTTGAAKVASGPATTKPPSTAADSGPVIVAPKITPTTAPVPIESATAGPLTAVSTPAENPKPSSGVAQPAAPSQPSTTKTASTPNSIPPSPTSPAPGIADAPATTAAPLPTAPAGPTAAAGTVPPSPGLASAPAPAVIKPDDRVTAFVEAVRVTGIRSSGAESRVLMNDRFYRVNDVVDRTLNIRLVKVALDSLTFADANGVTYVKNF